MQIKRISSFRIVAIAFLAMQSTCNGALAQQPCAISPAQLQVEALNVLRKNFPERRFEPSNLSAVIKMENTEIGLQNIRARLCLTPNISERERQTILEEHFKLQIPTLQRTEELSKLGWVDAQRKVTIQLMSSDYLIPFGKEKILASIPFVEGIYMGIVIETPTGYFYVREQDRLRWKISEKELFEIALRNLDLNHSNVKLKGSEPPDPFIASEEKDGFDAARILLPWVRKEVAKRLGNPFFAAVPNRDFLIMWGTRNSSSFQTQAKQNVESDYNSQPYKLSSKILKVWANGKIEIAK